MSYVTMWFTKPKFAANDLNMKKYFLLLIILISFLGKTIAEEGMWLPQLLQSLNEKQMKKMGMKINASDIYNISKGSLKDAIVSFGGFCTAEVISDQGLLLTNHHCGFDAIQNHSSIQNNYIRDGFWSYNKDQELRNDGLFATFIIRIDDVTASVLKDVNARMSEKERQSAVDKNIAALRTSTKKETYQDLIVRPFLKATNITCSLPRPIVMYDWLALLHLPSVIMEKIPTTGCGQDIQETSACSASMQVKTISLPLTHPKMFLINQNVR